MFDARKPVNSFVKMLQSSDMPSSSTMRRDAARELYELPQTVTPYGQIVQKTVVVGKKGSLVWDHLNIFAFFNAMAAESRHFFNLMRKCVGLPREDV